MGLPEQRKDALQPVEPVVDADELCPAASSPSAMVLRRYPTLEGSEPVASPTSERQSKVVTTTEKLPPPAVELTAMGFEAELAAAATAAHPGNMDEAINFCLKVSDLVSAGRPLAVACAVQTMPAAKIEIFIEHCKQLEAMGFPAEQYVRALL